MKLNNEEVPTMYQTQPALSDLERQDSVPSENLQNSASEITPNWWQRIILKFIHATGFNAFTAAVAALFFITSLALGPWMVALHFKHKVEIARLSKPEELPTSVTTSDTIDPDIIQSRIDEAQKQLAEVQTQLASQNADKVLSNQELLGIQNNTLQKEIEELAKPQLDAPIIDLDPKLLPKPVEPAKEAVTIIEVPPTAALFSVILHKPVDKVYPLYLIELLAAKKTKPLWSAQKKQSTATTINLTLLRRNYPSGKYSIRLTGLDGKKKEPIDTFNLDVKYPLPPKQKKKK